MATLQPTGSNAAVDRQAGGGGRGLGPAPTDSDHAEVVEAPRDQTSQQAAMRSQLGDSQGVRGAPLQLEGVVVSGGGAGPAQLHCCVVACPALLDRQVDGRLRSCRRDIDSGVKLLAPPPLSFRSVTSTQLVCLAVCSPVRPSTAALLASSPLCVMTSVRYSLPGVSPENM